MKNNNMDITAFSCYNNFMNLFTPLNLVNRSFAMYAKRLQNLNIVNRYDLLYHIPFRYDDYSRIVPIDSVQEGDMVTVIGQVISMKNTYTGKGRMIQKAVVSDKTGTMEIMWFNQPYLTKSIGQGSSISLSGRVELLRQGKTIISPEYELLHENEPLIHTGRLVPIYPETKGVSSKWLRRQIARLLRENTFELKEFLPETLRERHDFMDITSTLRAIHFPNTLAEAGKARSRLAFDELFLLQLYTISRRHLWRKIKTGTVFSISAHSDSIDRFIHSFPFHLTSSQKHAVDDIFLDLQKTEPMNRLIQGDVGSGKTVIAAISMFAAFKNGCQSVLMAPTEILAQQHFATIQKLAQQQDIRVGLATGNTKQQIDKFDILIGTHAVLSEKITYANLGLVVIDEQQRFGVEQRGMLRNKGVNPHLLTMTATPIPRTIALTMYGDLDISLLKEMPKGRKVVKTWLVPHEKREGAYEWIKKQVKETTSQIFIICPFIEESENMQTVKAAQKEFEYLKQSIFPDIRLGLLHGKLKPREKDHVLKDFREGLYDILVATPVVEVGIDIPNATVIMIEAAERFGLAQLHQLRGRVGRGEKQSYCLLFTESKNPQTITRLKSMETIQAGSELAELDFTLRGAGDMYGTAQSGFRMLKIASFSDMPLIEIARSEAKLLYPHLKDYPLLEEKVTEQMKSHITPD